MDKLVNLAQKGIDSYNKRHHPDVNKTGGEGRNAPRSYGHPQSGVNKTRNEGYNVTHGSGQAGYESYDHPQSDANKTGGEAYNAPHRSDQSGHGQYGHLQPDANRTGGEEYNAPYHSGKGDYGSHDHPQPGVNRTGGEGYNTPHRSGQGTYGPYDHPQPDSANINKTGGEGYNAPHHPGQASFGSYNRPRFDQDEIIRNAAKSGSGDYSSLFSSALRFLDENKKAHEEPLNEGELTRAHDNIYNKNDSRGVTSQLIGSAAALEVIKKFAGESGPSGYGTGHGSSHGLGGNSQTQLISMAMAEAVKLFDKSGGQASGNKQDAVNGAAMTVMKLLVQSKFSGSGAIEGKDSGSLGSLQS